MQVVDWVEFEEADPELASHVRSRLIAGLCYLATIRPDGLPRVHPVGVQVRDGRLIVPMTPTSPKGGDIKRDGRFALHCSVENNYGGEGEVLVTGLGSQIEPPTEFAERGWIAFHLRIAEVLSVRHIDREDRPQVQRWKPA